MEEIVKYVSSFADIRTVISLIAFVFALTFAFISKYNKNKYKRDRELIESAPEANRQELIEQVLTTWGLSARNFSDEQKFDLIKQKESQNERRFYFTLSLAFILICLAGYLIFITQHKADGETEKKIILMDSGLKDVVYNSKVWENGGSNTDEINTILLEISHFKIIPYRTSRIWRMEDQVLGQKPDLIIIHMSCFYDQTNVEDSERKFYTFLDYISKLDTKLIIYSRGFHHPSLWLPKLINDIPSLAGKVDTMTVGQGKDFSDPVIRRILKIKVKSMLNIS